MPTLTEFAATLWGGLPPADDPKQAFKINLLFDRQPEYAINWYLLPNDLLRLMETPKGVIARAKNEAGYHVYVGVNPRRGGRSKRENVAACCAIYADVDVKDFLSPAQREAEDIADIQALKPEVFGETLAKCAALGLPPTIAADSGRGLHLYWVLPAPLLLPPADSPDWQPAITRIETKIKALGLLLGGDPVGNLNHNLRLPGFCNRKPIRKGAAELLNLPVQIIALDAARRYALDAFPDPPAGSIFAANPPATSPTAATPTPDAALADPPAAPLAAPPKLAAADKRILDKARTAKNGAKFCQLYDAGNVTGYRSQNDADFALVGMLAFWTKYDRYRIDRLFRHSKLFRAKWDRPLNKTTYGWYTIDKLLAQPRPNDRQAYAAAPDAPAGAPAAEVPPAADAAITITPQKIMIRSDRHGWYQVADFGLKLLYRIADQDENVTWQAAILPGDAPPVYVTLSHEEFATPARFHAALLRKGFVFKGDKYELNLLKEALIKAAQPAEMVWRLGQHPTGGFVFANGVWHDGQFHAPNQFSMVTVGEQALHLPFASGLHLNKFKNAARIVYAPIAVTLPQWLTQYGAAYGAEGLLPFCFYVAGLFRDLAFARVHFFPIKYLRGPHGTGKSSLARSLTALAGYVQPEINLGGPNTAKSLPRLLDQASNLLTWFNEYRNDLPGEIRKLLEAVYDGGGYQRAVCSMDSLTSSVDIFAALLLTSNYTPDNDVFLSRCVITTFPTPTKTDAQTAAYDALQRLEGQGLGSLTAAILTHRPAIEREWDHTYAALFAYFRQQQTDTAVDTRTMANMAVLLTPAVILMQHGALPLKAVYGETLDLREEGRRQCLTQQAIISGKGDLAIFFELLTAGIESGQLRRGIDVKVFQSRKYPGRKVAALRMHRLSVYYQKEYRALYNKVGLAKSDLDDLLHKHPAYLDNDVAHFSNGDGKDSPAKADILDYAILQATFQVGW